MEIIAFAFEADYHCRPCTKKRMRRGGFNSRHEYTAQDRKDGYDLYELEEGDVFTDREGNLVHPVFDGDEWWEPDPSIVEDYPIQTLACSDCFKELATWEGAN